MKPHPGLVTHYHIMFGPLLYKLFLNLLSMYDGNVFRSSPESRLQSSEFFGNLLKFSEKVLKHSCGIQTTFEESLEMLGKWSEIFGKLLSEMFLPLCYMYIINKR